MKTAIILLSVLALTACCPAEADEPAKELAICNVTDTPWGWNVSCVNIRTGETTLCKTVADINSPTHWRTTCDK